MQTSCAVCSCLLFDAGEPRCGECSVPDYSADPPPHGGYVTLSRADLARAFRAVRRAALLRFARTTDEARRERLARKRGRRG